MTTRCSIGRAPDPLRDFAPLGEPLKHILLSAEVHLVRRASSENGARYLFIVLTDVEGDETPHRRLTVEGVQEKPRVLQLSPERFDREFEEMISICASPSSVNLNPREAGLLRRSSPSRRR